MKVFASLVLASLCLGAGPATEPTSQPAAPKRVVFAIDGTASMIGHLPIVKQETLSAIHKLQPSQMFAIVVAQSGKTRALAKALLPATPANIEKASSFLNEVQAYEAGDDEPAILAAIALRPDVIMAITDGDMAKPDIEIARIVAANKAANKVHAKINTSTLFSDPDQQCRHNLWKLANLNGGQCIGEDGSPIDDPGMPATSKPNAPKKAPGNLN